jgi:hypothetical protein
MKNLLRLTIQSNTHLTVILAIFMLIENCNNCLTTLAHVRFIFNLLRQSHGVSVVRILVHYAKQIYDFFT